MTLTFVRSLNQILAAGIGITALSLWFYTLTFNLRNRVTLSYAVILLSLTTAFGGEALGSAARSEALADLWFHVQWLGVIVLPAAYLHFSDALLATTGRPSRGRRRMGVWAAYGLAAVFLWLLVHGDLLGPFDTHAPLPHYAPTVWTWVFAAYYLGTMAWAWVNFVRAYRRTVVRASRRRMGYLLLGALAPTLGAFPYATFLGALTQHAPLFFWFLATVSNLLTTVLLVVMAYAVAFFGVAWPDRVVRIRLFRWLLRGPVAVSTVLALTTVVRRIGERFGETYTVLVPLTMVLGFLLVEHLIGATAPFWEYLLVSWRDDEMIAPLQHLEERLFTRKDLAQFFEAVLAALCDQLRVSHAFIAVFEDDALDFLVTVGEKPDLPESAARMLRAQAAGQAGLLRWGEYLLMPLHTQDEALVGVLGFPREADLSEEAWDTLHALAERAVLALEYYLAGSRAAQALWALRTPDDFIPRLRAAARYNQQQILAPRETLPPSAELAQWVKDALSHYWGGPKLSRSPLTRLQIIQQAMNTRGEDASQAVRSVLRDAVERLRPEGERRFTTEWLLYNILEMKFLQGRKVREVASRLALSEANFYRKQRVALEEVARVLLEMEAEAREKNGDPS